MYDDSALVRCAPQNATAWYTEILIRDGTTEFLCRTWPFVHMGKVAVTAIAATGNVVDLFVRECDDSRAVVPLDSDAIFDS